MSVAMNATTAKTMTQTPGTSEAGARGSSRSLVINGERRTSDATTLAELLVEAGYADSKVATALNGEFVPARTRPATPIADGDHIEIVAPRQGG